MSPLHGSIEEQPKIIGPASTLKLVGKSSNVPPLTESDPDVVPKGMHWVDMADEGTIVVIEQPSGQTCAALGGIMAARMKVRGVEACIVGGRVRDLAELRKSGLPVSDKQMNCNICVSAILLPWPFHHQMLSPVLIYFFGPDSRVAISIRAYESCLALRRIIALIYSHSAYIPLL
jgi:Aldolase/RraA